MSEAEKPESLPTGQKLSEQDLKNTMTMIPTQLPNKTKDDSVVSPAELYEQQRSFFHKELLESTSVLNESITLLSARIKQSFAPPDQNQKKVLVQFERYDDRANMETLAKLVQTKINFIKALK